MVKMFQRPNPFKSFPIESERMNWHDMKGKNGAHLQYRIDFEFCMNFYASRLSMRNRVTVRVQLETFLSPRHTPLLLSLRQAGKIAVWPN